MVYERHFTTTGETAIATFEYTDIADATGTVIFDAFQYRENKTDGYAIAQDGDFWSMEIETTESVSSNGANPDLDFNLSSFNLPRTAKGVGFAQFSSNRGAGGSFTGGGVYPNIIIRKWDGSTETDLVEASGAYLSSGSPDTQLIRFEIPRTHFKKGDTLRVTAQIVTGGLDSGSFNATIAHDPKGRDGAIIAPTTGSADTSTFKVHIPFQLDL
jgi:hypothetical protein